VDVTIAYERGQPLDLGAIALGTHPPCVVHVHYRTYDVGEIPTELEKMRDWMYELYYEKDAMLAKYYATGVFPHDFHRKDADPPR